MTLDEARALMHAWVESPSLRAHMEAVAACMAGYARLLAADQETRWTLAGLLHDLDYERHPDRHPWEGVKELERRGIDEEVRMAVLGHADHTGVARTTLLARCLYAVDELAGFLVACAKVRPRGIEDLEPPSVRKKLKDRAFAAAVSREGLARAIAEFPEGGGEESHLRTCLASLREARQRVGV